MGISRYTCRAGNAGLAKIKNVLLLPSILSEPPDDNIHCESPDTIDYWVISTLSWWENIFGEVTFAGFVFHGTLRNLSVPNYQLNKPGRAGGGKDFKSKRVHFALYISIALSENSI